MKLYPLFIFLAAFSFSCTGFKAEAQIRATGNGKVVTGNTNQKTSNPKKNTLDISTIDFKNFTYPDYTPNGKDDKTFTLKNGRVVKKLGTPNYALRKLYHFDLTGDERDEAITHIIADGCELGCESSSLFFIHTTDENRLKLLWKIAIGGDTMGGLKTAHFTTKEIVLETFGECTLDGWLIKTNIDLKKNPQLITKNYTRFVFSRDENGYTQTERDIFPLANLIINDYRPQISFGEKP